MKVISDKEELKKFYDLIVPELKDYETGFVSMSARNKYLTEEEREYYKLGRTEMFGRQIMRYDSFEKFYSYIARFETIDPLAYTTKNGKPIPDKAIVCYININPSNTLKAIKEFNQIMNEYYFELATCGGNNNIANRINKAKDILNNCYQKNRGTKYWIDIDFDCDKDYELINYVNDFIEEKGIKTYHWIDTKSGFHLLIKREDLNFNPVWICPHATAWMDLNKINYKEVEINKNEMIPIPGTYQAGYPVTIYKE